MAMPAPYIIILLLNANIGKKFMPKEGRNIRFISLQRTHEGLGKVPDIVSGARQSAGMDR